MRPFDLSLYLVLDPELCAEIGMVQTARLAVEGGVSFVQMRHKTASTAERVALTQEVMAAVNGRVPVVVNDDVEAALAAGADGAHIGQEDGDPRAAREVLGADKILGLSVETPQVAQAVDRDVVDYVGVGPVFATPTKEDHKAPTGWDGYRAILEVLPPGMPNVAIGGLKAQHRADALKSGADGLAVVSAICGQPDPRAAARLFTKGRSP